MKPHADGCADCPPVTLTYRYRATDGWPLCPFCAGDTLLPIAVWDAVQWHCTDCRWKGEVPKLPDAARELLDPPAIAAAPEPEKGPGFWRRFAQRAANVGLAIGTAWATKKVGGSK